MRKVLRFLGAGLLSFLVIPPFAAGVSLIVTTLVGQVSKLDGWWNALFLTGVFLTTFSVAVAAAQVAAAALEQHGPLAKRRRAGEDLRAAYGALETALLIIHAEVDRALETRTWWLTSMTLPAEGWNSRFAEELSRGASAEEREVVRVCRDAFLLANEANRLVHRHHANPPTDEHMQTLERLRDAAAIARETLGRRLDSRAVGP